MKFTDILKKVIVEQSRMEILADKLTKPQGEKKAILKPEELFALIVADPESKIQEGVDIDNFKGKFNVVKKVGPYTQWLIKQYLSLVPNINGEPIDKTENEQLYKKYLNNERTQFWEDLYKTTEDLKKFHRFKNRLPQDLRDINKLSINTLFDNVKDFSLEKTKASAKEKEEAAKTFIHPGAELIYDGPNWVVTKVSDKGQIGKDAACFFGGYNEETRWCTSAPGLNWFDRYIKDGPLYQVFNKSGASASKTGLPSERYQFHFPSNQFMDINDRQIDLVKFLSDTAPEIKDIFKSEFAKGLTTPNGKELTIDYPRDATSKYVALYGWDDLFKNLNRDIESFDFSNHSGNQLLMKFPKELGEFENLQTFFVENALDKVPEELKGMKNLQFISLPNNKSLKELPEWLADLPELIALSIKGTPNDIVIPERLKKEFTNNGGRVWFVHND